MKKSKEKIKAVDIHDDALLVKLGIRNPNLQPRAVDVWTKTPNEKRLLKEAKNRCTYKFVSGSPIRMKSIPVRAKLIVYTDGSYGKSTYSFNCLQSDIQLILSKFRNAGKDAVKKYSWNGKSYRSTEVPFWH